MKQVNGWLSQMGQGLKISCMLMLICGLGFPLVMNGLGAVFFPVQAAGNKVMVKDQVVGAAHVGQEFSQPYFMKGRPSAVHYNTYREDAEGNQFYLDGSEFGGLASGSNNLAPSNPQLVERVEADIQTFLAAHPGLSREAIPTDLLTASGSGLDPEISPAAAAVQLPALAKASNLSETVLRDIVQRNTDGKLLGIFGAERVNVLAVNIEIAQAMGLIK